MRGFWQPTPTAGARRFISSEAMSQPLHFISAASRLSSPQDYGSSARPAGLWFAAMPTSDPSGCCKQGLTAFHAGVGEPLHAEGVQSQSVSKRSNCRAAERKGRAIAVPTSGLGRDLTRRSCHCSGRPRWNARPENGNDFTSPAVPTREERTGGD